MMKNFLDNNFSFENEVKKTIGNDNMCRYRVIDCSCQDQVFGSVYDGEYRCKLKREDIEYNEVNGTKATSNNLVNPIVVILESPHIKEFYDGIPKGPARGTTGKKFNKLFSTVANTANNPLFSGTHSVVMINSVQFQCSLGKTLSNSPVKDRIWQRCFFSGCGQDLLERLEALQPAILINACTKGKNNLQMAVHASIHMSNFLVTNPNSKYFLCDHPSAWNKNTTLRCRIEE